MTIAFVGAGAQVVGTGASLTPSWPAGYTPTTGDFAVVIVGGKATDATEQPADPSGWAFRSISTRTTGASVVSHLATYYRALQNGDSAPSFAIPATWQGGTLGNSVQVLVYSGVDTSTPFDVSDVVQNAVAAATFTPSNITTATDGAMVVNAVYSSDDNALDLTTANGFTARMSGASYDTTTGNDHSIAAAEQLKATAGVVSGGTWTETTNGTDAWLSITMALKPSSSGTVFNSTLSGAITPAGVLVNKTTKPLTGAIGPAGALVNRATKVLAGSISPAGVLATTKLVLSTLAGAITPSGTLVNRTTKILAGAVTPAGALVKQLSRAMAGTIAPAGALVKTTIKPFTAALSPAGALVNKTVKILAGTVSPSATLTSIKVAIKTLTGAMTPGTSDLQTTFIPAPPEVEPGKLVEVNAPTKVTKLA